jgi:type VI secretion system protein VasD
MTLGTIKWAIGAGLLMLVACASQEGPPEPKAVPMVLTTDRQLNPHADGSSQSVDVLILYLSSPRKFEAVQLSALYPGVNKPVESLGADLVDSQLVRVVPGDEQIMELQVDPQVRYIGIVVAFEQFQVAKWRGLVTLRDESALDKVLFRDKKVLVTINNLEVVASLET